MYSSTLCRISSERSIAAKPIMASILMKIGVKASDDWTCYVGFGIDDPNNNDIGFVTIANTVGQISLNQVA